MVNITKRMHKLMPKLWQVKGGPGAAIIPLDTSVPQLKSLILRVPSPAKGADTEARTFWHKVLPAMRYYNLTIPMKVEQFKSENFEQAPTLHLEFEATTRAALEKQKAQPSVSDHEALIKWGDGLRQRARRRDAATEAAGGTPRGNTGGVRSQQEQVGIPKDSQTTVGPITAKAQPAADPSQPSTTSPPGELFQRSIQLGMRGRSAVEVWRYIQELTNAETQGLDKSEKKARYEQVIHDAKASQDRRRVKIGIDTMRREREELKRAKEAAERLTAEA